MVTRVHASGIRATVLLDSVSPAGARITTFEVRYPRFLNAEVNTHKRLSRNTASSRAIPSAKILEQVREDPFIPPAFGRNGKGMQAHGAVDDTVNTLARTLWRMGANTAAGVAEALNAIGIHKQWTNRLVEPFMWQTSIITATCWRDFYRLRCHKDAQPEFQILANLMREAHLASVPVERVDHLPLVTGWDEDLLVATGHTTHALRLVSAGRCARVSYLTHLGDANPSADIQLAQRLRSDKHLSPFEHPATALPYATVRCDNMFGWRTLRKDMAVDMSDFNSDLEYPWETR